jgi:molecular chaperone GrpE
MSNTEAKKSIEVEDYKEMDGVKVEAEDTEEPSQESTQGGKTAKVKALEEMTKKELMEKLKATESKAQENYDLYLRTYAEMENIKKRGIREKEELAKFANETLIKEILPIIDNLEKALSHVQSDHNSSGLVEGIELTLNNLLATLEKAGIQEVEALGKPFDPNFHEAISQQAHDTVPPNHVILELQKGYLLNGRLIRPSMVVISKGNSNTKEYEEDNA